MTVRAVADPRGRAQAHLGQVALADVVSDAVAGATPITAAKGVRLVAEQTLYPTIRAAEPELGRVLLNLLSNAIRHTPYGQTINVEGGADKEAAWISVSDGCGGIRRSHLPRVFESSFRGETAWTPLNDAEHRAGLGLAIARGLVEAHPPVRSPLPTSPAAVGSSSGCR